MIDIRVCYPAGAELALRCSSDWSRSIQPIELSKDGTKRRFRVDGVPEGGHLYSLGYDENVLKHYPVLYVLDGAKMFFPDEAFSGQPWAVDQAVECLDAMNLVDKMVVVALYSHPDRREEEYTAPGYHAFGEELA